MLKINADIFAHLLVFDLIRIIDILFPVSKQVLLLRDKKLDDASLQLILIKQIAKTHALKEQRNFLSKEFILSSLPSYKIISNHAKILSQAGVFSIMSKDYRNAKNFYKSINKSKVFKKDYAAKKLRQISEWIDGVKDFSENEGIREILGVHYNSVDTDFTPFKEVIQLFKDADECFAGMDYIELRKFIKYGDIDQIQSLPKLSNDHSIRKFPNLTLDNMSKETNILKECEEDITKLQNLICVLKIPEDEDFDKSLIDELPIELEKLLEALKYLNNNDDIKNIFGHAFKVEKTTSNDVRKSLKLALNLTKLDSVECAAFIHCAQSDLLADLKSLIIEILQCRTEAYSSIKQLANLTVTKPEKWVNDKSLSEVSKFMKLASKDRDGLICYSRLLATKNDLTTDGYNGFVDLMLANKRYNLCESIEALIMRAMARATYEVYGGTLSSYNGSNLALYRKRLQESDRKVIKLSRQRVQSQLYHNATPPVGNGNGKKSDFTDLALLKHEISKKRQHISIRSLTKKAASALSELKPCWMMSPLAVAQYIPKDGFEFDLLIIDEASQMTPEDAIGAIIRSKQVMVVGDTNQLPPTTFFRKGSDDEESEEDEKVTEESILEIANTRFKPSRRLRWHYRSRDASLIAFSNKYIYNDNLVVFPSAQENHPSMGVEYIEVNGIYSASTNLEEAKVMVNATMNFIKKYPEKSLGIVLMNKKQRDLLDEEMNLMLTNNNDIRMYKRRWEEKNKGLESFFIKNLENVQGDERDVIFIGTVYGPEKKDAPVMQRFGPIAGINGKRRLNVLFSRAKERIVTFSSMTASDIRAEEGGNPGAYLLGRWLEYSASKILHSGEYLEKEPDSAFEEHVIQQIKSIGCEAIPQVGVKGFAIDIGVKHTDWKHGFIMGVECDGAAYHSSVSARDRDRLRQEVLEGLGWSLYRIWSTDWFEDPRRETEKLRNAITERLRELQSPS